MQEFVDYFYIDDGLASFPTEGQAVTVLKKTQEILFQEGKFKLHNIASNIKSLFSFYILSMLC